MPDSIFKMEKSFIRRCFQKNTNIQTLSQRRKITRYINDNLEIFSDNSDEEASDEDKDKEQMLMGLRYSTL